MKTTNFSPSNLLCFFLSFLISVLRNTHCMNLNALNFGLPITFSLLPSVINMSALNFARQAFGREKPHVCGLLVACTPHKS